MKPLDFLKSGYYEIKLGWIDKNTYGLIDYEKETITINLELFVVSVLQHEKAHAENPRLSEKRVLELEHRRVSRMTKMEIRKLAKKLLTTKGIKVQKKARMAYWRF